MLWLFEGAALGFFQCHGLRTWLPNLPARRFIGVTALVAAVGWFAQMSMPLLATIFGWGQENVSEGDDGACA